VITKTAYHLNNKSQSKPLFLLVPRAELNRHCGHRATDFKCKKDISPSCPLFLNSLELLDFNSRKHGNKNKGISQK
jgi:hypothetical protein